MSQHKAFYQALIDNKTFNISDRLALDYVEYRILPQRSLDDIVIPKLKTNHISGLVFPRYLDDFLIGLYKFDFDDFDYMK